MNKTKGFSLLEVLITLVLTTVGILGMVVLQNKAIRYTQDAVNRDNAVSLANDLIEIMRAHKDDLFENKPPLHYTYSKMKSSSPDLYTITGGLAFSTSDCPSGDAQTLKQHAGCWLKRAEQVLPQSTDSDVAARFKICPSYALASDIPQCAGSGYAGSTFTVQLAWKVRDNSCDPSQGNITQPSICTYITRGEL